MLRLILASAALVAVVACSDDPTAAERRATLTRELAEDLEAETDGALDTRQATCVAEALVEEVGVESFDRVVAAAAEAAGDAADDGDRDELRHAVIDAFADCDALDPLLEAESGAPPG